MWYTYGDKTSSNMVLKISPSRLGATSKVGTGVEQNKHDFLIDFYHYFGLKNVIWNIM